MVTLFTDELLHDDARDSFNLLTGDESWICLDHQLGARLSEVSESLFDQDECLG